MGHNRGEDYFTLEVKCHGLKVIPQLPSKLSEKREYKILQRLTEEEGRVADKTLLLVFKN